MSGIRACHVDESGGMADIAAAEALLSAAYGPGSWATNEASVGWMDGAVIAAYLDSLSEKYGRFAENPDYEDQPQTRGIFRTVSVLLAEEARHVGADHESGDQGHGDRSET